MKHRAIAALTILAFASVGGAAAIFAPVTFRVPFAFQAGGNKKLTAGAYTIRRDADTLLVLRHDSTAKETAVRIIERIPQPTPAITEPQLVFDEVGDFAPSYTEYFTVYILSEAWLPGEGGYRVHVTKGAHNTKVVKGAAR